MTNEIPYALKQIYRAVLDKKMVIRPVINRSCLEVFKIDAPFYHMREYISLPYSDSNDIEIIE